jgi:hypothetical protein
MKKTILALSTLLIASTAFNQQEIHRCGTVDYMNYRESVQPGYIQSTKDAFHAAKHVIPTKADEVYVIPVVVHVVYKNANANLHDSVIHDQIRILNEDYGRMNADASNLRSEFHPYAGDAKIQFVLASFDPNGNPTTGITRTQTSVNSFVDLQSTAGMMGIERVKSTADGGIDPWNQSRYLNIWICDMSFFGMTMLLGYATPPANLPNWPAGSSGDENLGDGVVIQYQVFGSNNPNPMTGNYVVKGRTVTHEVGHYLGLRHIWGDGDCTQEDGIDDTPNAVDKSNSDCNTTKNTCVDNIDGVDLPDMVENFMDYSAETCQNTFTKGQVALMRGVLENQRWDLINDNDALGIKPTNVLTANLYPNPAENSFTVSSSDKLINTITVMDVNGKVVYSTEATGTTTNIQIGHLKAGVYQVVLQAENASTVMKLVKM